MKNNMTKRVLKENNEELKKHDLSECVYLIPDDLKDIERFKGVTATFHESDDEARNFFNDCRRKYLNK